MKPKSFQDFLEEYWMDNLAEGEPKDQSIDATERWIENLDVQEVIDYAELYGKEMYLQGMKHVQALVSKPVEL